jgi:acyl carrier protein
MTEGIGGDQLRSETDLRALITATLLDVAAESGVSINEPLTDDLVLLQSGLDSLGFAILVARLEEDLGWDPFTLSDDPFYPSQFGEFVAFYEANQP